MPVAHKNLHKIPDIVERPIPGSMRNLLDWDFTWSESTSDTGDTDVWARLTTDEGEVKVVWMDVGDNEWRAVSSICPPWPEENGFPSRRGPTTTRGISRWLRSYYRSRSASQ